MVRRDGRWRAAFGILVVIVTLALVAWLPPEAKAADPAPHISATSKAVRDRIDLKSPAGCSHICGFNYQPSWGHNGLTVWGEKFDAAKYRHELALGKKYFPKFNAVRIWLSWSAYRANPQGFVRNFQAAVDICGDHDLLVVPVIFNRWTGAPLWDRVEDKEMAADFDTTFGPFIRAVILPMKGDPRVLAWDLCNEPQPNKDAVQWVGKVHQAVKQLDWHALTCVGTDYNVAPLKLCLQFQDILTPHPYFPRSRAEIAKAAKEMAVFAKVAKDTGKPMMATECCWGSLDDAERVEIIRANLQLLKQHKIGFFPHALWTSGVADLHRYPLDGYYMPFILGDGSLRPGHEAYNEFTR